MAAITSEIVYEYETGLSDVADSPYAMKEIMVVAPDTADDTDTMTIPLADYGITTLKFVQGYAHTTNNSVIITEAPTTSVSNGVLTITVGGSADNDLRVFRVGGI